MNKPKLTSCLPTLTYCLLLLLFFFFLSTAFPFFLWRLSFLKMLVTFTAFNSIHIPISTNLAWLFTRFFLTAMLLCTDGCHGNVMVAHIQFMSVFRRRGSKNGDGVAHIWKTTTALNLTRSATTNRSVYVLALLSTSKTFAFETNFDLRISLDFNHFGIISWQRNLKNSLAPKVCLAIPYIKWFHGFIK